MTVQELTMHGSLDVKLGAKQGSAFVYCGDLQDINFPDLDKQITDHYKQSIENADKRIRILKNKPKDYASFETFCARQIIKETTQYKNKMELEGKKPSEAEIEKIKERYRPTPKKHREHLERIETELKSVRSNKRANERKLKDFTTIAGREIVETYPSITEKKVTIVLYEGIENGFAWDSKEYADYKSGKRIEEHTESE